MKRVVVHIDRLVLKGFRHEDRYVVGDALREELGRQFASADAVRDLVLVSDVSRLKVGEVRIMPGAKSSQVGALAARGIAREVTS